MTDETAAKIDAVDIEAAVKRARRLPLHPAEVLLVYVYDKLMEDREALAAAQREVAELREQNKNLREAWANDPSSIRRSDAEARVAALEADRKHWAELTAEATNRRIAESQRVGELAARYQKLSDGLVEMQRHRDAWRNYAYVGAAVPDDYLDGNKVDRQPTRIEALEAALAATKNALICYGAHEHSCAGLKPGARQYDDCSCGFAAALAGVPVG